MKDNQHNLKQIDQQTALKQLDVFVDKWHAQGKSYGDGQQKDNPYASAVLLSRNKTLPYYDIICNSIFVLYR